MQGTTRLRITKTLESSPDGVNSVKLTVIADPDTGKLIERRLDLDFSGDDDATNAVESEHIEQLRVLSAR